MSILFGTNLENAKAFLKVRFSSVQAITNLRFVANFSVFFFCFLGSFSLPLSFPLSTVLRIRGAKDWF